MKAIIHTRYGSPDFLQLRDIDRPVPGDDEVLVQIRASSVNDWDAAIIKGRPYVLRLFYGFRHPKVRQPGCDVAGVVEAIGKHARRFQPGDAVYGDLHACGFGTWAEYVCAPETALEPKPERLSFEQAAAIPHGATLAWQALNDMGRLRAGQKLLINGAGGGVGPVALQLARPLGLEITGVDSAGKLDLLRSMGFDHVIDYRHRDFTRTGKRYDFILDVKTDRSPFAYARALEPGGIYVTVGGSMVRLLQAKVLGSWVSTTRKKDIRILILKANRGLAEVSALIESGAVTPLVDGPYPLREVPDAVRHFESGDQQGRIVIAME
jgi:NADPH:quinone reductase-like Zn-dependent oxidoreductase